MAALRVAMRGALKAQTPSGGNVDGLVAWVDRVGFDAAVGALKSQVNPDTGQPYGEERATRVVEIVKARAGHAAAKPWGWGDVLKSTDARPACPQCGAKASKVRMEGDQPRALCDACDKAFSFTPKGAETPTRDETTAVGKSWSWQSLFAQRQAS